MTDSPSAIGLDPEPPAIPEAAAAPPARKVRVATWFGVIQTFLVCGVPTQVAIAAVMMIGLGMQPFEGSALSLEFFATLSFLDTAVVALLILVFLTLSGETSRDVFIGPRSVKREIVRGFLLIPIVFIGLTLLVVGLRTLAPWLHNVAESPLEGFMDTPLDAAIFLVVVVLAGGVREELQRAFILHRCRVLWGVWGVRIGLAVFTIVFGALHYDQGFDVAIAVGLLGLFWGIMYIRRRSAILGMTNHAGFNAVQVAQVVFARWMGV
jgi:membrane protease YdiL (CAAX protease family)